MFFRPLAAVALCASGLFAPLLAAGPGDLLVAPTRVVLESGRGTEVILNNIGEETATYRISLELRRMLPDGTLGDVTVAEANALEKTALAMISYAPRRVVLAPNQPQSIRIGIRPPAGLADGEYRAHMLFRAIPAARPVTAADQQQTGVSIALTPIYGVTIPVIIRRGALKAEAFMTDTKLVREGGRVALHLSLGRKGTRSTYGRIRILKAGVSKPVYEAAGIAIYAETSSRTVELGLSPEVVAQLSGPVTVQYVEDQDAGGKVMAEVKTTLR
jgi:P pilus assembly chaperone PapD